MVASAATHLPEAPLRAPLTLSTLPLVVYAGDRQPVGGTLAARSVTVDIATRFLLPAEDIYIIRPGQDFSLYRSFLEHRVVFLDFPDLQLDPSAPKPTREKLREAVVRSMRLRDWHRGGRVGAEPSRRPQDYRGEANGRRVGRYVGAVERLYYDLPKGTIIAVPGPGYFSDVLIGELGPVTTVNSVPLYPNEPMLARRIRWRGKRSKSSFSGPLRDRLQMPTPLMVVDRSLRRELLEAAFDQFSLGDTFSARIRVTNDDFSVLG